LVDAKDKIRENILKDFGNNLTEKSKRNIYSKLSRDDLI
jgi:hypothetical protein